MNIMDTLKESFKDKELLTEEEEIAKQLEEIDIDDLIEKSIIVENYDEIHMNVQTTPTIGSNNQVSSSSPIRLTTTENISRTMQPLRQQSNYEFSGYSE